MTDVDKFINNFNLVDNAIHMRTIKRWNGRDLLHCENLSEHTHLVTAYSVVLYEMFKNYINIDFEKLIYLSLLHDSLEVLRGDILSITKNSIPGLRSFIDNEENYFINNIVKNINEVEKDLVSVADALACYRFIELEYERPHNKYTEEVYISTRNVAYDKILNLENKYGVKYVNNS